MERWPLVIIAILVIVAVALPLGAYTVSTVNGPAHLPATPTPAAIHQPAATAPPETGVPGQTPNISGNAGGIISTILESRRTYSIDNGTEGISILEPYEDSAKDNPLYICGKVNDTSIDQVTVNVNGIMSTMPVSNGTFYGSVNLTLPVVVNISAADSSGRLIYREMVLDGDMLTASYEKYCGFNPLASDSDCSRTIADEADNGVADGFEMLDGKLPVFVKAKTGADAFADDTDADGLTDYFEVVRIALTSPVKADSDDDGVPDSREDPDHDGLTNLEEQELNTDPLVPDTDKDTLLDGEEIAFGSDPNSKDTDGDGLDDAAEKQLGMNPREKSSDLSGTMDSSRVYTVSKFDNETGITVVITGTGDAVKDLQIRRAGDVRFYDMPARVSIPVDVRLNKSAQAAEITIPYNPANLSGLSDPENLSVYYYNRSIGTLRKSSSTVDPAKHTVTATVDKLSPDAYGYTSFVVLHVPTWDAVWAVPMAK